MSDEIQRSLGRIEGMLQGIEGRLIEHFNDDKINFGKIGLHTAELRKDVDSLQRKWAWASGWGAAAGGGVTLAVTFVVNLLRAH